MEVYLKQGNAMYVHASASFTDQEIEDFFNHEANEHRLTDGQWKMCPLTEFVKLNRVPCGTNPNEVHACLTKNGEALDLGLPARPVHHTMPAGHSMEEIDDAVDEIIILTALSAEARKQDIKADRLLKKIVKDYLKMKGYRFE